MTELALLQPAGPDGLAGWADSFVQTARVSSQLARTAFVPASLRVFRDNGRTYDPDATAAQVTAAILTGRELGMEPMAALRSINIIQSTPALSALALRALLLARGHDIKVEDATNTRATVAGRRAGSEDWQRITWTMDDAKARNLAWKPNWRSQPRNMLIARATADVARLVAADALLGVPYTVEELEDQDVDGPAVADVPSAVEPARRTAQRRTRPAMTPAPAPAAPTEPAAEDEPPLDDGPQTQRGTVASPEVPPPAAPHAEELSKQTPVVDVPLFDDAADQAERITAAQSKKLHAELRAAGLGNRIDGLTYISGVVGRDVTTSSDLFTAEASAVLDALSELRAQESSDE